MTEIITRPSRPAAALLDDDRQDDPRRELWIGGFIVIAFCGGFLLWASLARMDAAAVAGGQVAVSGHRQTVQHKDGGAVAAIAVREGQHVNAGQVLISLAPAEVGAQTRAISNQVIDLEAQRARLLAELAGRSSFAPPPEFAGLAGEDRREADQAMQLQRTELAARSRSVASQKTVLSRRTAQLTQQISGYEAQAASARQQSSLIGDELTGTKSLAARGYASVNRVRALQRTAADLQGQQASYAADAARSQAQIGENQAQAVSVDTQRAQDAAKDLRDVEDQLNLAQPKLAGLKDQLARTDIRAPVSGQVVGLTVFNVGAVITPGEKLMDIVPDQAPLHIEAQISPIDADDLHVGQGVEVRVSAFHERNLPVLKGEITRVSADSFVEEHTGQRYFTADIMVPASELARLEKARGRDSSLKPGLPVQIMVPLRKRSALQYMVDPLTQAVWRSFHEH